MGSLFDPSTFIPVCAVWLAMWLVLAGLYRNQILLQRQGAACTAINRSRHPDQAKIAVAVPRSHLTTVKIWRRDGEKETIVFLVHGGIRNQSWMQNTLFVLPEVLCISTVHTSFSWQRKVAFSLTQNDTPHNCPPRFRLVLQISKHANKDVNNWHSKMIYWELQFRNTSTHWCWYIRS